MIRASPRQTRMGTTAQLTRYIPPGAAATTTTTSPRARCAALAVRTVLTPRWCIAVSMHRPELRGLGSGTRQRVLVVRSTDTRITRPLLKLIRCATLRLRDDRDRKRIRDPSFFTSLLHQICWHWQCWRLLQLTSSHPPSFSPPCSCEPGRFCTLSRHTAQVVWLGR